MYRAENCKNFDRESSANRHFNVRLKTCPETFKSKLAFSVLSRFSSSMTGKIIQFPTLVVDILEDSMRLYNTSHSSFSKTRYSIHFDSLRTQWNDIELTVEENDSVP